MYRHINTYIIYNCIRSPTQYIYKNQRSQEYTQLTYAKNKNTYSKKKLNIHNQTQNIHIKTQLNTHYKPRSKKLKNKPTINTKPTTNINNYKSKKDGHKQPPNTHKYIDKPQNTSINTPIYINKNTKNKNLDYTQINGKLKSSTKSKYYILILLLSGDTAHNPGPMPNILKRHPTLHKKNAKLYFIPNTIKLHPEYKHIAQAFAPLLKNTHPLHELHNNMHPYISQYIQQLIEYPSSHILYAIVITIHPSIDYCDIILHPQNLQITRWTNTLLQTLASFL
jgi:hypothetical protein